MRVAVIINPMAGPPGRMSVRERVHLASTVLASHPLEFDVFITEQPGHAYELAQTSVDGGAALVYAWGGDGTVNEIARALAFGPAALAVIPAGSGNGLARELGIPFAARAALEHALGAPERLIDVGRIAGRLFFNIAGVGIDAAVAARVSRGRRGLWQYITATTWELLVYQPVDYRIDADGATVRSTALTIAFANSRQYGYDARVAPLARLDDGWLEVIVIEPGSVGGDLLRVRALFNGTFHRAGGVMTTRARTVRLETSAPMRLHVDGEPILAGTRLDVEICREALKVRA